MLQSQLDKARHDLCLRVGHRHRVLVARVESAVRFLEESAARDIEALKKPAPPTK
jgi:hypothetical protein